MIRDAGWFNLNSTRAYPLDDTATGVDDRGELLPPQFLVDAALTLPDTYSDAFVMSAAATAGLVTVIIGAWNGDKVVPVAAATLLKPVESYTQTALSPLVPGAMGWVSFGDNESLFFSSAMSTPAQGRLCPRQVRYYPSSNLLGIRKFGGSILLSGLIQLQAGDGISITRECRVLQGLPGDGRCEDPDAREVVVFRLKALEPAQIGDTLQEFAGNCGKRAESRTCDDPPPIESLGGVTPDCAGVITIELRGCAALTYIEGADTFDGDEVAISGVMIDCAASLTDACVTALRIPAGDGRLPNEFENICQDNYDDSVVVPVDICDGIVTPFVVDTVEEAAFTSSGDQILTLPIDFPAFFTGEVVSIGAGLEWLPVLDNKYELSPVSNVRTVAVSTNVPLYNFYRSARVDFRFTSNDGRANAFLMPQWFNNRFIFAGIRFDESDKTQLTLELGRFSGGVADVKTSVTVTAPLQSGSGPQNRFVICGRWYRHPTIANTGWLFAAVYQLNTASAQWTRLAQIDSLLFCDAVFNSSYVGFGAFELPTASLRFESFRQSSSARLATPATAPL